MEHFDRETLTDHKIKSLFIKVSRYEKGKEPPEYFPCVTYIYGFDKRGNIVESGIGRTGSTPVYVYDEQNQLVTSGWKNKQTGELDLRPLDFFKEPEYSQYLPRMQARFDKQLSTKVSYKTPHTAPIVDICASLDANYRLKWLEDKNNLPVHFKATKQSDRNALPERYRGHSPQHLYISYEYTFFDPQ
ncbi:hypothetical protein C2869_05780 [Saccharobesus litoralis]|uniref:Uncharacterized protein n=1 Tax=Saccharobesus litoralis TaxID=2172099 RepID=A0A2S0VP51_9ALTE|nr:hypothetical protein [Saccharobesus litoralis]AWB65979.1 hypothetical protein C2869_05780 [Saccharobesus litoralis]